MSVVIKVMLVMMLVMMIKMMVTHTMDVEVFAGENFPMK